MPETCVTTNRFNLMVIAADNFHFTRRFHIVNRRVFRNLIGFDFRNCVMGILGMRLQDRHFSRKKAI